MSCSRWESSSGDARLQTSLQPSLCSVWPEHHVRSQLWWMFHPAVSLSPLFNCICLSPVATHLTSLPAAVTAQCLCLLRTGGQSWSHPPVHSSTQQGCKPLLRHSQQFSPQSWRREAGGCTSVPHTHFILVTHRQHLLSLTGYFLPVKKKSRENTSPEESSFSFPPVSSILCTAVLFKKLLKDTRWIKETGNHCVGQGSPRGRTRNTAFAFTTHFCEPCGSPAATGCPLKIPGAHLSMLFSQPGFEPFAAAMN